MTRILRFTYHLIFNNVLKTYYYLNFLVKSNIFNVKTCNARTYLLNGRIYVRNRGQIIIGQKFSINSGVKFNPIGGDTVLRIIAPNSASVVKIGDNVGISNSTLFCMNNINIGNNVLIGGGCKIWDTDFHSIDTYERVHNGDNQIKTAAIFIEDNVFIGAFSIVLKGVRIGQNSIIGAGSVVTKDIPANVIAVGNPCKVIKQLSSENLN